MVCPWAYGGFEGWHVDRWLSSRAGLSADVLRGRTSTLVSVICSVIVNCSFSYKLLYIQIHASPLLLEICRQYDLPRIPHFLQIKPISSNWRYVHSVPVKPNATAVLHYQT